MNVAFCFDIFNFLLQPGCRVDAPTQENQTALHLAASEGYSVMCEILLDYGACVNAKDNDNDTPLHITLANETLLARKETLFCTQEKETLFCAQGLFSPRRKHVSQR